MFIEPRRFKSSDTTLTTYRSDRLVGALNLCAVVGCIALTAFGDLLFF
jgi:hypothetical protein